MELEVSESTCRDLVEGLIEAGVITWSDIAEEILQAMQPPQTATHVPQLDGIRELYESRQRWAPSRRWMYAQYGRCGECGALLSMTHDHVLSRDLLGSKADYLENLRFLCRRCNQARHWEKGNILAWGTAAAVQYLLHTESPSTVKELEELGKELGLTQSNQRYEEAWALAVFLSRQGQYDLSEIHPTLPEEELEAWSSYYDAANTFFAELDDLLRDEFDDKTDIWGDLRLLVTTRPTKREERIEAARSLGIYENDENDIADIVEKPRRNDSDRRAILNEVGFLTSSEINDIVGKKKVTLFHLLSDEEQEAVLTLIEDRLEDLKEEHLGEYL